MSYSETYEDGNGTTREVTITEEDSKEALKNDYEELKRRYNPRYVSIERMKANEGEAMHLKVTVHAPSHYLNSNNDMLPKPCNAMSVYIICYPGYPLERITATYDPTYYLASPNVFNSGAACIDSWIPLTSSLLTVVEKLVLDMIHDPIVTNYDSMAYCEMKEWHKLGVAKGEFPTIPSKLLHVPEKPPLPSRHHNKETSNIAPPLPARQSITRTNTAAPSLPARRH